MGHGGRTDRWNVPEALRQRMIEIAREFRKTPTASEALLWESLRSNGLDGVKFRRRQPIGPFVVDFYTPTKRLVVEVDGGVHDGQREADRERQFLIESLGVRFARIASETVENDLAGALDLIREAIAAPPLSPRPFLPPGEKGEERGTGEDAEASSGSSLPAVPRSPSSLSPFPPWWGKGGAGDRGAR